MHDTHTALLCDISPCRTRVADFGMLQFGYVPYSGPKPHCSEGKVRAIPCGQRWKMYSMLSLRRPKTVNEHKKILDNERRCQIFRIVYTMPEFPSCLLSCSRLRTLPYADPKLQITQQVRLVSPPACAELLAKPVIPLS